MHIISFRTLRDFFLKRPDAEEPLRSWHSIVSTTNFGNLVELREVYPHADQVGKATVFNISGNKYRLITAIHYNRKMVFILEVMTHAEYSKNAWQQRYRVFD